MGKKLLVTTMPFEFTPEQISESIEQNSGKLVHPFLLVYEIMTVFFGIALFSQTLSTKIFRIPP